MKQSKNNWIFDLFIQGIFFIILLVISALIPGLSPIILWVLPIPIVLYTYKYDIKKGLLFSGLILLSTSVFMFTLFIMSLPVAILAILAGLLVGQAIRKERHPYETLAQGTMAFMIGFIILIALIEWVLEISLATEYRLIVADAMLQSEQTIQSLGMEASTDVLEVVEENMLLMLNLIPGILLIGSFISALLLQWSSYKLINRNRKIGYRFPYLRSFQLPRAAIWLFLLLTFAEMFMTNGDSTVYAVIQNISLILGIMFMIQGISFVFYYVHVKKKPKKLAILFVIISLIIFPVGVYVLRILGIIDIGFRMRKRLK